MNLARTFAFSIPVLLSLSACTSGGGGPSDDCTDPSVAGCVATSTKERIQSPNAPDADVKELVAGNTAFAVDLYQQLRGKPGNLFYSPFSISEALAMAYAGARNDTAKQMATALHFSLPDDKLHPAFNSLDLALASRGQCKKGQDGNGFRLNVANALWGQTSYPFAAPFLDTLAQNYGAGVHVVDFIKSPEPSRQTINQWVSDKTEDKIKDLLPPGTISSDTRLVLTNAVYFNAAWEVPFKAADTKPGDFTRADSSKVSVPMMAAAQDEHYAHGEGWAALSLPYDGDELSMLLVLPDAGTLDAFEASFTSKTLDMITSGLSQYTVTMTLPKFKFSSSFGLVDQLSKLGMTDAFTGKADFSGIDNMGGLAISDVVHKAYVNVDEAGTEAAAATGEVFDTTSLPPSAEIHFDHPFLFLIRDNATGEVIFFGRVVDPSAS